MANYTNKPQKDEKTLQKEEEAFQLRTQGWSQLKIAEKLGMTQQGISKALKRATQRFTKAYLEDMKQVKEEQVAQLENVASEAIGAWYESKKVRKSTSTKDKGKKVQGEKTTTEEHLFGDPRYLTEFRKAKADIREVLGLKYIELEDDSIPALGEIRINIIKPTIPDDADE